MIFKVGDKVKLTQEYIETNHLNNIAYHFEFIIIEETGDLWYPYSGKMINHVPQYIRYWYFRGDEIEYTNDYISPETIREYNRIMNNPLPRYSFMKKVVDTIRSFF